MVQFNFNESSSSLLESDERFMRVALEVASRGEGFVEPNPMVGAVLVCGGEIVGVGYHRYFGGCHAEVLAIEDAKKNFGEEVIQNSTCYVTLEPCSHYGKTPPCADMILRSGIKRVVIAMRDPNPVVNGRGVSILRSGGVEVTEGILEGESRYLNAPYLTLLEKNRSWVIAKWAMTLDGRLSTNVGRSKWISNESSRIIVQKLRRRVDAIMIGSNTARVDDPSLTVRIDSESGVDSVGCRVPLRIVLDSRASISLESNLVRTAREFPLLVVVGSEADSGRVEKLLLAGCEILEVPSKINLPNVVESSDGLKGSDELNNFDESHISEVSKGLNSGLGGFVDISTRIYRERIKILFRELAQRKLTNILVEGGGRLFGTLFDLRFMDEAYVFISPKLVGGCLSTSAIGGVGISELEFACMLSDPEIKICGNDVQVHGRLKWHE
ncbi:MAG: bifunctional diaminohydroxyphosphoribosylaminopyrimidine deaminase/5-amino-6-(5-phosphoribosylamino)uracil reductase RibD [Planctomycetaceae bacterium]|jgi:diaminohydroxyphosphoribosylaminopyrimidine deaminase/5-amino-6-(5-phosphoribosylamino)uracil reductase|nr:bifunctional diaminohydroxyphosphoribosylaminopyrimidine deaminase/5-amino-6-(5-phosphoribosylamino)uracil reductase RibD [Planctomycetaceae bacterium]